MIHLSFNINQFETSKKKFFHFFTDSISISVLFAYYDMAVGLDPGMRYIFVTKNNENIDNKKKSVKMSSRQYYHDTKFNWNKGKQQQSYKRHQDWLDYSSYIPSPKTSKLEKLQCYAQYALDVLDTDLQ